MKYIALDFDGTLTDENHIIDLEALWSATMIQRMGIDVFMVSGRTAYEMYFLAKHTGLKTIVVGENGGVVIENSPSNIIKLANKKVPLKAFEVISNKINVEELLTIPRLTEVVLKRTFDLNDAINIIKNENIESKCKWSPFNGFKFKGTPTHTIIAGKIKMQGGKILGDPDGTPLKFS